MENVNDSTLIATSRYVSYYLTEYGNMLDSVTHQEEILDMLVWKEYQFFLSTTAIYRNNYISKQIDTFLLPDLQNEIINFTGSDNFVFLNTEKTIDEKPLIVQLALPELTLIDTMVLHEKRQKVSTMAATEGRLYFSGKIEEIFDSYSPLDISYVESVPVLNSPQHINEDIGISDMRMIKPFEVEMKISMSSDTFYIHLPDKNGVFECDITNYGDTVIHSFAVSGKRNFIIQCSKSDYYYYTDSVSILPGETYTFTDSIGSYNSLFNDCLYCKDFTFTSLAPNHQFDHNPSNDVFTSEPEIIVSVDDPTLQKRSINIYPNPSNEKVTMQLPEQNTMRNISVYDYTGRQVWTAKDTYTSKLSVSVQDWPVGIYFVKIEAQDSGQYFGKIVVSR